MLRQAVQPGAAQASLVVGWRGLSSLSCKTHFSQSPGPSRAKTSGPLPPWPELCSGFCLLLRHADQSRHSALNFQVASHNSSLDTAIPQLDDGPRSRSRFQRGPKIREKKQKHKKKEKRTFRTVPVCTAIRVLGFAPEKMLPVGGTKRKSDQISTCGEEQHAAVGMGQQIPTAGGSPHDQEGPFKKRRLGITPAQKQALIDNLRLESTSTQPQAVDYALLTGTAVTERARKLRANYNIHAQSLRTRIEIRVNRIPMSLRKLTMGELLQKYATEQQQKPAPLAGSLRGPPLLAKDPVPARQPVQRGAPTTAAASTRPAKRPRFVASLPPGRFRC